MPRNVDARDVLVHLNCGAIKTLTKMLHEEVAAVGDTAGRMTYADVQVRFKKGDCSKFMGAELSEIWDMLLLALHKSARFSESGGSESLQIEMALSKVMTLANDSKQSSESCGSFGSLEPPPCKGTLFNPQCLSESKVIPSSKKKMKKNKGKKNQTPAVIVVGRIVGNLLPLGSQAL